MSIKEKYDLVFSKAIINGKPEFACMPRLLNGAKNSTLTFLNTLDDFECESFKNDLIRCLKTGENIDEGFYSDGVEHMEILYEYPNVNIDNVLIISMSDLKDLLEEWLEFIRVKK